MNRSFPLPLPTAPPAPTPASDYRGVLAALQPATAGFTSPSQTFARMRQMHALSAEPLYRDVKQVGDPVFREAYEAWYERAWLPFFGKYAGPNVDHLARFGALFTSDEVSARAEALRQELEEFYRSYPYQRTVAGQLVPPPSGQSPALAGPLAPPAAPWWAWALGAVVIGGVGYLVLEHFQRLNREARRRPLRDYTPGALDAYPELAAAYRRSRLGPGRGPSGR